MTRKHYSSLFGTLAIVIIALPFFINPWSDAWLISAFVLSVLFALVSILVLQREARKQQAIGISVGLPLSVLFVLVIFPICGTDGKGTACLSNIKQLSLAVLAYSADNNDMLPLAINWREASSPYRSIDATQTRELKCPVATTPWDYALNTKASGIFWPSHQLERFERSVLLFEAAAQLPNASGGLEWFDTRHNAFGMIGFVDGHVKAIKRERAATLDWDLKAKDSE